MTFSRFAIYATLPDGPAFDFCTSLLGWDSSTGRAVSHPALQGLPLPIEDITETPRKYGLHGTIKAPFRLADGTSLEALHRSVQHLCANLPSVRLQGMSVTRLGGFLALTAQGDVGDLNSLAAQTVRTLDMFRAPLTDAEITRRMRPNMPEQHVINLERWGYPHVMDAFRFHMTLTGKMPRKQADQTLAVLKPVIDPLLPAPFVLNSLSLMGQDASGMFHEIQRFPFGA